MMSYPPILHCFIILLHITASHGLNVSKAIDYLITKLNDCSSSIFEPNNMAGIPLINTKDYEYRNNQNIFDKSYHELLKLLRGIDIESTSCEEIEAMTRYVSYEVNLQREEPNSKIKLPKIEDIRSNSLSFGSLFEDYILHDRLFKGAFSITSPEYDIPATFVNNYLWRLQRHIPSDEQYYDITRAWPRYLLTTNKSEILNCPLQLHIIIWNSFSNDVSVKVFLPLPEIVDTIYEAAEDFANKTPIYHKSFTYRDNLEGKHIMTVLKKGEYLYLPAKYAIQIQEGADSDSENGIFLSCYLDASNFQAFSRNINALSFSSKHLHEIALAMQSTFDQSMLQAFTGSSIKLSEIMNINFASKENNMLHEDQPLLDRPNRRNKKVSNQLKDWQNSAKWQALVTSLTLPQPSSPVVTSVGRRNVTLQWFSPYLPDKKDQTSFGFNITICTYPHIDDTLIQLAGIKNLLQIEATSKACQHRVAYRQRDPLKPLEMIPLIEEHNDSYNAFSDPLSLRKNENSASKFSVVITDLAPNTVYQFSLSIFYNSYAGLPSIPTLPTITKALTPPTNIQCLNSRLSIESCVNAIAISSITNIPKYIYLLQFVEPVDNGGEPIIGYHVQYICGRDSSKFNINWKYFGHFPATALTRWKDTVHNSDGAIKQVEIHHLIANLSYVFRITPYNSIGNSTVSVTSNVLTSFPEVYHESSRRTIQSHYLRSNMDIHVPSVYSVHAKKFLMIDDYEQVIAVMTPGERDRKVFNVWSSHWSPKSFLVEGPCVLASPWQLETTASEWFEEASHQRIVFVGRGGVPMIAKVLLAQSMGALAVVVVDDGRCSDYDQECMPGASKKHGLGFARLDSAQDWHEIKIPVVFVLQQIGEAIADLAQCTGRQHLQITRSDL